MSLRSSIILPSLVWLQFQLPLRQPKTLSFAMLCYASAELAIVMCPSIHLFVTCQYCVKVAKCSRIGSRVCSIEW